MLSVAVQDHCQLVTRPGGMTETGPDRCPLAEVLIVHQHSGPCGSRLLRSLIRGTVIHNDNVTHVPGEPFNDPGNMCLLLERRHYPAEVLFLNSFTHSLYSRFRNRVVLIS